MIRNYLKSAWRGLIRNKAYGTLNILGMAIGMSVALIIGLWVYYQYSYDKFLPDYKQLFQVKRHFYGNGDTMTYGGTSLKLANVLRQDIPEIEYVVETDLVSKHGLSVGTNKFYLSGSHVQSDFLKAFQYELKQGNAGQVLQNPYSIVITEKTAKALFGSEDPMNKSIRFDNKNDLTVTGVLKDLPSNATLQFDYLVPFSYLESTDSWVKLARTRGFGWTNFFTCVKLKPGVTYAQVESKIRNLEKTETDNEMSMKTNIFLDPLKNWHLYENYETGKSEDGFIVYVKIFTIVGLLVLLIACINFINLTTARSEKRAKEVGVRKAIGSGKSHLIFQFLTESILLTFISFLLSLVLVEFSLPAFNHLTDADIHLPFSNPVFWLISLTCVVITGVLAGSRPAFYLSSFEPVKVLKGKIQAGKAAVLPRKILVVTQFSCSIALIICTYVIYQQVQYAKNRPSGYDRDRLMITDMNDDLAKNYVAIKDELIRKGVAESVTTSSNGIISSANHRTVEEWPGKKPGESVDMGFMHIDDNYFKSLGIKMKDGRDFSGKADTLNVIFNEAAVALLRLKDPINQTITWIDTKFRIVGIVNNALTISPFASADPTMFFYDANPQNVMMYRLRQDIKTKDAIAKLTSIFSKYNPAFPYSYTFADEGYAAKFKLEELIGKLSGLFAGLAIFISCLGLFGLAAYIAEQRKKEIGIRKVLGASISQVWLLLSRDFILLVIISCIIASPVAYYYMNNWLEKYNYRTPISPVIFIIAAFAALLITVVTVSFQAIRAAIANPVDSLRSE